MAPQPGKAAKVLDPPPEFLAERLALWDRLKAEQDAALAAKVPEDITVTLPDGKEVPGQSWRTTPYEVSILKTLFQKISRVLLVSQRSELCGVISDFNSLVMFWLWKNEIIF